MCLMSQLLFQISICHNTLMKWGEDCDNMGIWDIRQYIECRVLIRSARSHMLVVSSSGLYAQRTDERVARKGGLIVAAIPLSAYVVAFECEMR